MSIKIAIERNLIALVRKRIDAIYIDVKMLGEDVI